jgi:hypothetical protein
MKAAYAAAELAGLPGLPTTTRGILHLAARERWPYGRVAVRGGWQYAYPARSLPRRVRVAIDTATVTAMPRGSRRRDLLPYTGLAQELSALVAISVADWGIRRLMGALMPQRQRRGQR